MENKRLAFFIAVLLALVLIFAFLVVTSPMNVMIHPQIKWEKASIKTNGNIVSFASSTSNGKMICAVSGNAFFVSRNGGENFSEVFSVRKKTDVKLPDVGLKRVTFVEAENKVVFALENGEEDNIYSFNCQNDRVNKIFSTSSPVTCIKAIPGREEVLIATYGNGIYRISKNSTVVQLVRFNDISYFHFTSIDVLPSGRLIAGFECTRLQNTALPVIISNKNGVFETGMYNNVRVKSKKGLSLDSVSCVCCIDTYGSRGVYVSTNSDTMPLLFTKDGVNFTLCDRAITIARLINGVHCVQVTEKSIFITNEVFLKDASGKIQLKTVGISSIPFNKRVGGVYFSLPKSAEDCIYAFLAGTESNRLFISTGKSIYYAPLNPPPDNNTF